MVLSTENGHDTTFVSLVLLLTTPISGLTVKRPYVYAQADVSSEDRGLGSDLKTNLLMRW